MSKTIGVIAEDLSDVEVITNIIGKYVCRNKFAIKKFVGNGCGKLRNKCDSWVATLFDSGCDHVLVFHDLDRNNERSLRKLLLTKIPISKYPNTLIIIPTEELEAWLLADEIAIRDVFNLKKSPNRIENCESITSPKEHLKDIVWSLGKKRYLNTSHNKKISEKMSIENLKRCHSFEPLDRYIKSEIFKISEDAVQQVIQVT